MITELLKIAYAKYKSSDHKIRAEAVEEIGRIRDYVTRISLSLNSAGLGLIRLGPTIDSDIGRWTEKE